MYHVTSHAHPHRDPTPHPTWSDAAHHAVNLARHTLLPSFITHPNGTIAGRVRLIPARHELNGVAAVLEDLRAGAHHHAAHAAARARVALTSRR